MERDQQTALILDLIDNLLSKGSWCGETHIQKAAFFLQKLLGVPTDYEFILYRHGPFSFDLRDEITDFRALGLLKLQPMPMPYGPTLRETENATELIRRFPVTVGRFRDRIELVAECLGNKRVAELERLATALYVTLDAKSAPTEDRAAKIGEIKPRVPYDLALAAVREVDSIVKASEKIAALSQLQGTI